MAVVAVDPSSPFSGGPSWAIAFGCSATRRSGRLHPSLATRGALGGLSRSARDVVRVLDVFGADVVSGRDGRSGPRRARSYAHRDHAGGDGPGMGDDVQAIKGGIFECADVFAVNKPDGEGADSTVRDLELMIALGGETFYGGSHGTAHGGASSSRSPSGRAPFFEQLGTSHPKMRGHAQRRRERALGTARCAPRLAQLDRGRAHATR